MPESGLQIAVRDIAFMEGYAALWHANDANSFFRSPAHIRMIAELSASRIIFIAAYNDKGAVAALPAAVLDGPYGSVINSLPYYGTCSAVVGPQDDGITAQLYSGLLAHARAIGAAAITLVDDWRAKSFSGMSDADFVTPRSNQFIELAPFRSHNPIERYHQKTRNLVRKAEKLGVKVRLSQDLADIDGLAAAHHENMAGVNGIAKPGRFFEMLRDPRTPLGGHKLYVADMNGRDCAYLLNFYCGDTVEYYMPAVHVADRGAQPLSLLIHTAIQDAARDGFAYWNFGGTWPTQHSLKHFKIRWGSDETSYGYFTHIFDKSILCHSSAELLAAYPYFYVAPFDQLGRQAGVYKP